MPCRWISFGMKHPNARANPRRNSAGHLIFFTKDDVTIRRPSGAILVIDNYEIAAISDSKTRLEAEYSVEDLLK